MRHFGMWKFWPSKSCPTGWRGEKEKKYRKFMAFFIRHEPMAFKQIFRIA
jgi:hypothetical protein